MVTGGDDARRRVGAAFRQGLKETGTVLGPERGDRIPLAEGQYDRLPALTTDLVGRADLG